MMMKGRRRLKKKKKKRRRRRRRRNRLSGRWLRWVDAMELAPSGRHHRQNLEETPSIPSIHNALTVWPFYDPLKQTAERQADTVLLRLSDHQSIFIQLEDEPHKVEMISFVLHRLSFIFFHFLFSFF